jgi:hypothetical protein
MVSQLQKMTAHATEAEARLLELQGMLTVLR